MILRATLTIFVTGLALTAPLRAEREVISNEDRAWWAFQPIRQFPTSDRIFEHKGKTWSGVDAFLMEKLTGASLGMAPEAPREVLVRRAYFDLLGLPPTREEVAAFINDRADGAWERLLDRLLASAHYGERWARHWLDLARYADSDGYKADDYRPDAWRYRDWVISAFNDDMPYDKFIRWQLAGDELHPDNPAALIATGFLRCGIYEYNNRDVAGQWTAILNDITDTTSDVFLGLGLQCARCHDHKFDPLLQKDYFRLQAFFASLKMPEQIPAMTPSEQTKWQEKQTAWETATVDLRRQMATIEDKHRADAERDAVTKFPPETQSIMAKTEIERTPREQQWHDLAWKQVTYEWGRLEGRIKGTEKEKMVELRKALAAFDYLKPPSRPMALAVIDVGPKAPETLIPAHEKNGVIEPGVPTIFDAAALPVHALAGSTGRRSALAAWITNPMNPLTARVMVNRVWQQHFGHGLSTTASDLGKLGDMPSHPELLDWLASRFVTEGWSLKKLHRIILTSAAWKQGTASHNGEHARLIDPANRLLWRWNTRRLDGEQIRDAIFSATGELDLASGGPGADHTKSRRAIFTKVLRNVRDPLLDVFDAPQHFNSTPSRDTTTTPTQSLMLANSRFLLDRSESMSKRLLASFPNDTSAVIDSAWQATIGKHPTTDEREEAMEFISTQAALPFPVVAPEGGGAFLSETMPQRSGKAAVFTPGGAQERLIITEPLVDLPPREFALETVILLRSIYSDGRIRTIASQWNGDASQPGWALGVTGQKSRRKPQIAVLQLIGRRVDGRIVEEAVFSDIPLQMDRSYAIAASVQMAPNGGGTVTFFIKDLANDDEPMQTTVVPHPIVELGACNAPLIIGDMSGETRRQWDGLVDEFRIRSGPVTVTTLSYAQQTPAPETVAFWAFEPEMGFDIESVSQKVSIQQNQTAKMSSHAQAVRDFCHSLLSSSAFLYLE